MRRANYISIFLAVYSANLSAANIDSLKVVKCLFLSAKFSQLYDLSVDTIPLSLYKFYSEQANLIPRQQREGLANAAESQLLQLSHGEQITYLKSACQQEPAALQFLKSSGK